MYPYNTQDNTPHPLARISKQAFSTSGKGEKQNRRATRLWQDIDEICPKPPLRGSFSRRSALKKYYRVCVIKRVLSTVIRFAGKRHENEAKPRPHAYAFDFRANFWSKK